MAVKTRTELEAQLSTGGSRDSIERNFIKDVIDSIDLGTETTAKLDSIESDAEEAHALNATFSDTEVEAALDALGAKLNALIDALKA